MFKRLLRRERRANEAIVDALYAAIVAAARQPRLYSDWGVPDTPLGRFEMMSLHMVLLLRRLRGKPGAAAEIAQALTDMYFLEVDHSLRELGVGDIGVPKRMKRLAKMFYGRAQSYGEAVEARDVPKLALALHRNVRPDLADWSGATPLAAYVMTAEDKLSATDEVQVLSGSISFPAGEEA